ncbi:decarboxylase [Sphaerospermopsis aphanizomenoides BCCUSP55]|uniref:pyridoxal-dependent decarboxylase n=1 Tax=Sphaerospermopsis aphanizomenoides TaxID=459663 RepID=UPI0019036658|nr:pyridoxal-dependent decarboxylase [Sphaerospermopsis aphanizomenoides]MBK1989922.1 decarboxylase [Sphaerospermopsis aphanizomenoides BCCUSP55]
MKKIKSGNQELSYLSEFGRFLELEGAGSSSIAAWFLGQRAENLDELERLIVEALRDQAFWRRNFHPGDPSLITEQIKRSPEYLQAIDTLRDNYRGLLGFLKKSVPFFSSRYQGHMNWDTTMPAILGYFATMLYNPNNVAFEGSTATTILELLVGDDLCKMLGYPIPSDAEIADGKIRPWGHITCGGTIANIEAIWSARNLKFYPIALQAGLKNEPSLQAAKNIEISLLTGGSKPLVDLDTWTLLNLEGDKILDLPNRLTQEYGIKSEDITAALTKYSLQNLGIQEFSRRYLSDIQYSPVFFVPGTKHYSFPKAAAILGIGSSNMIDVPADVDARMDIDALDALLQQCLEKKQPVYTVVSVIGSTEESAVDPLTKVLALREKYRLLGLEFTVHADAAWGCYFAAMIRDDEIEAQPKTINKPQPQIPMSEYVTQQFQALTHADSITADPHKSGYIPYPAGALCYRNSAMRDLVTFKAPYVAHGEAEPTIGIYGVEGSKPGAAAAAVYLSHKVIRPTKSGYGKIHGQALFNCNKLYARLLCMAKSDDRFVIVPVPRLPAEISGDEEAVKSQIEFIRNRIDQASLDQLLTDAEAMTLLAELGPDQNILTYAFNFKHPDGTLNTNLNLANRFNKALYDVLSIKPGEDIYTYRLIVSTTDFEESNYGKSFIDDYKRRLGVGSSSGSTITVLRSTVLDPWLIETDEGSFLDVIENEFRQAISKALFRDNLLQIFEEIDVNQDGLLDRLEIDSKLSAMGYSPEQIEYFWQFSNIDRDSTLTKQEFINSYSQFLVYSSRG